jgi:hypothetical protein
MYGCACVRESLCVFIKVCITVYVGKPVNVRKNIGKKKLCIIFNTTRVIQR